MKRISPYKIKVGQYYIQEWSTPYHDKIVLLKKRIRKEKESPKNAIWGKIILILSGKDVVIHDEGDISYFDLDGKYRYTYFKFYSLKPEEVFLYKL